jgi:hypothetical protein
MSERRCQTIADLAVEIDITSTPIETGDERRESTSRPQCGDKNGEADG